MHSNLDETLVKLPLLHEEHHLTSKKTSRVWSEMNACGSFVFVILMLLSLQYLGAFVTACLAAPFLIISINGSQRMFRKALGMEETNADLGAAKALIENYGVRRPSMVAASLFRTLRARPRDRTSLAYRVRRLLTVDFHPSDNKRVKAIQELEESIAKGADEAGDTIQ